MYDKEKAREYYLKNKEEILRKNKKYLKTYKIKNKKEISEQRKKYYEKNKEQLKKYGREYFQNNKTEKTIEHHKKYCETWYLEHKEEIRVKALMDRYGLTLEEYEAILERQGNRCSICGKKVKNNILCVDHNHETGKIRGLLCGSCNLGLGIFKDSVHLLRKAVDYLDEFGKE